MNSNVGWSCSVLVHAGEGGGGGVLPHILYHVGIMFMQVHVVAPNIAKVCKLH